MRFKNILTNPDVGLSNRCTDRGLRKISMAF